MRISIHLGSPVVQTANTNNYPHLDSDSRVIHDSVYVITFHAIIIPTFAGILNFSFGHFYSKKDKYLYSVSI